jgi:hypothetical protein
MLRPAIRSGVVTTAAETNMVVLLAFADLSKTSANCRILSLGSDLALTSTLADRMIVPKYLSVDSAAAALSRVKNGEN